MTRCFPWGTVLGMAQEDELDPADLMPWLRRDALENGDDDRTIAWRVRTGEWHRVRRGAYLGGALWATLSPEARHRVLARAVLKTAHESTVLSHLSAAVELGAPTYDANLREVHVTRLDGHPARRAAGVVHHSGLLLPTSVIARPGVRLVNGTRAAFETTTIVDVEPALVIVNGLLHNGEADHEALSQLAHDARRWPNSLRSDLVIRLADGRCASAGETRSHYLFWKQSLPKPELQYPIRDDTGAIVASCDFAWPGLGVFAEFDGRVKYESLLKPGQTAVDAMLAQQRREELICRLTGWICIRLTWDDLARPRTTARRVRELLQRRDQVA